MQTLTSIPDALTSCYQFWIQYGAQLPTDVQAKFGPAVSSASPVDTICQVAEILYANMSEFSGAVLTAAQNLVGQLAQFAGTNQWHQLGNGRGYQIYQAMCRDTGVTLPVGLSWPDASSDPAPLSEYETANVAAALSTSISSGLSTSTSAAASLSTSASTSA